MRVVYVETARVLRMTGALGPLQSEAVQGVWTITLKSVGTKTRILFEYVVGGFMRYKTETISGAVDKVLAEQIAGLTRLLGPAGQAVPSRPAPVAADEAMAPKVAAEPVSDEEPAEYTPDPTKDEAAAGESVKSALDKLFGKNPAPSSTLKKDDARLPEGR